MVWFLAPVGWVAGTVLRRRVVTVGGVLVYTYRDELGEIYAEFRGDAEAAAVAEATDLAGGVIIDALTDVAGELGELSLDFIRGFIPAVIDGARAGYDAIRDGFRGKEPETIAALTISILVVIAVFTLLHEVKTGPGGAGEYAAGNRPSYPLE